MARRRSAGGDVGVGERPDALDRALDLLARRPHFREELRRKLAARGYGAEEIETALGRVAALGYLADERLAGEFAVELAGRKGLGRAGIGRELARRGAPEAAIEAVLGGLDEAAELERAREAAARWARRGGGEAAALARHLDRKGFTRSAIFSVLREFAADAGDPPGAEE